MEHTWNFASVFAYWNVLAVGLLGTLKLFVICTILGLGGGLVMGMLRYSKSRWISYPAMLLATMAGSLLGVVMIIPLRKQIIDYERLRFPEGVAVATILKSPGAGIRKARLLVLGIVVSSLLAGFSKEWSEPPERLPAMTDARREVQARALEYLPYAVAFPLVSVVAFVMDGVFLGATQNRAMRNAMLMSIAAYLAVLWLVKDWGGIDALWLCLLFFFAIRGVTL